MYYTYRCTTEKLAESLNRITEAGDYVSDIFHTGGRDWVLVCRKGAY